MATAKYLIKRLLASLLLLVIASFIIFAGIRATTDPTTRLRASKDPQAVPRERARLHLNENIYKQYGRWVSNVANFNLGKGDVDREEVTTKLKRGMTNTFELVLWGMILSALIAITFGVAAAINKNNPLDFTLSGLSFLGAALPTFFFAYILIDIFTVYLPDFFGRPDSPFLRIDADLAGHFGRTVEGSFTFTSFVDYMKNLAMPVTVLVIQLISTWSRYQRSSMIEALQSDYNRTAQAKGMSKWRVYMRHSFRNAQLPMVTIIALDFGTLMGGLIVTEFIFQLQGMGAIFIKALSEGDATTLTGFSMLVAVFVISANYIADIVYTAIDPRIRT